MLHIFTVLGAPGLGAILQLGPHTGTVEGDNHLPGPAGHLSSAATKGSICLPDYKQIFVVRVKFFFYQDPCSRNGKSRTETVIEHLVGRQGQTMGAQVHAMHFSDGWTLAPSLPRFHLTVGSGDNVCTWGLLKNCFTLPFPCVKESIEIRWMDLNTISKNWLQLSIKRLLHVYQESISKKMATEQ
ncbi:uncharacterized protein LOC110399060 isoform X2 [Numida meleagris]|uniref:uncharacterized protein LOC110399060 isoform X2 n=1 Tax=Numida meleagris TaxID=8996 RepID=UPI000B3E38BF|nr:uncharacterized protein LOC110399060 isoform X2 [Numida meleagris]